MLLSLVREYSGDIVIQRMDENAIGPNEPLRRAYCNDDRILQCAVHFMWFHTAAPQPCTAPVPSSTPVEVFLLTDDVNLHLKAHAYDVHALAWQDVADSVTPPAPIPKSFPQISSSSSSSMSQNPSLWFSSSSLQPAHNSKDVVDYDDDDDAMTDEPRPSEKLMREQVAPETDPHPVFNYATMSFSDTASKVEESKSDHDDGVVNEGSDEEKKKYKSRRVVNVRLVLKPKKKLEETPDEVKTEHLKYCHEASKNK